MWAFVAWPWQTQSIKCCRKSWRRGQNLLVHRVNGDGKSGVVPLHFLSVIADTGHVGCRSSAAATAMTSRVTYTTNSEGDEDDDEPDARQDDRYYYTWTKHIIIIIIIIISLSSDRQRLSNDACLEVVVVVQRLNVPLITSSVISGTIFTGHMTKPTVSKYWRKPVECHQHHSTMLQ